MNLPKKMKIEKQSPNKTNVKGIKPEIKDEIKDEPCKKVYETN